MKRKLTDKEKKQVIALYISTGNYSEVARKFNLSVNGVKKIVLKDPDSAKKFTEKKLSNTKDILEMLDNQKDKVKDISEKFFKEALNNDKVTKTGIQGLFVAYGIMIDKQLKVEEIRLKRKELEIKERELEIKLKNSETPETSDDGFINALEGKVNEVWQDEEKAKNSTV